MAFGEINYRRNRPSFIETKLSFDCDYSSPSIIAAETWKWNSQRNRNSKTLFDIQHAYSLCACVGAPCPYPTNPYGVRQVVNCCMNRKLYSATHTSRRFCRSRIRCHLSIWKSSTKIWLIEFRQSCVYGLSIAFVHVTSYICALSISITKCLHNFTIKDCCQLIQSE